MRIRVGIATLCILMKAGIGSGCSQSSEPSAPQEAQPTSVAGAAGPSGSAAVAAGSAARAGAPMPGRSVMTAAGAGAGATAGSPAQAAVAGASAAGASGAAAGAGGAAAGANAAAAGASSVAGAGAGGTAGGSGSAGAGALPSGATNFVAVCDGGKVGMDSDASMLRGLDIMREYAGVKMLIRSPNQVLSFKTTLQVPKPPTARQTLFIWPGLQSRDGAADPNRVGNGVLQPVLTWGPSCAPKRPSDPYAGWWIAGMYVTLSSNIAGPTGCGGGDYLSNDVGDLLEIDMFLKDEKWVTTIKNVQMNEMVDYTIDLRGQVQNEVMWLIEVPDGSSIRPVDDTIWTQNVLTFAEPVTSCQPDRIGSGDYFSAPILSPDGLHCCWDKIIMRAER